MAKEKAPIGGPPKQLTLTIENDLLEALRREAETKGYTVKDLIIFALREHLEDSVQ